MLLIIKYLWCILILGRKPKPPHEHSFGEWILVEQVLQTTKIYGVIERYRGKASIKRICSVCGEEQEKHFETGLFMESSETKDALKMQLSPYVNVS